MVVFRSQAHAIDDHVVDRGLLEIGVVYSKREALEGGASDVELLVGRRHFFVQAPFGAVSSSDQAGVRRMGNAGWEDQEEEIGIHESLLIFLEIGAAQASALLADVIVGDDHHAAHDGFVDLFGPGLFEDEASTVLVGNGDKGEDRFNPISLVDWGNVATLVFLGQVEVDACETVDALCHGWCVAWGGSGVGRGHLSAAYVDGNATLFAASDNEPGKNLKQMRTEFDLGSVLLLKSINDPW